MSTLTLDAETHTYRLDGQRIIGTTELLSCVGARKSTDDPWRSASGSEFIVGSEVASNFGKVLHAIAELMIRKKKFTYDKAMEPWVKGLRKFFADYPMLKTYKHEGKEAIEYSVWSKYGYAGTFDWLAWHEDLPWLTLIDWKSSTAPFPHWHMQTAAYEQAIRERFGISNRIQIRRWPVRILEGGYRVERRHGHPEDWHHFLSILNTYKLITKG